MKSFKKITEETNKVFEESIQELTTLLEKTKELVESATAYDNKLTNQLSNESNH